MDRDRFRGCLLGLACGDALGTTLEFKQPGSFVPIDDMIGGGPFRLPPGFWTDDTSMALCLAESLIDRGGFDPSDQMRRYLRWRDEGHLSSTGTCFDIGNTVSAALHRFQTDGNPYAGSSDPRAAGNGCIMRLAPVPMRWAADPTQAIALARNSSRTTHGALTCLDACRFMAGLLVGALRGVAKPELLAPGYSPLGDGWHTGPLCPEIAAIAAGAYRHKEPPAIRGSGYVVEALEAALWAFNKAEDFAAGALLAVNLGDDADTTGAIYGQIAGAYWGLAGIPEQWQRRLALRETLLAFADGLWTIAAGESQ
jgi:ADP-ribosyl-[dinitrogen reductase] hydrolase